MSDDALRRYIFDSYASRLLAEDRRRRLDETQRRVFYSFHYKNDNWRAGQVRNMGVVGDRKPVFDNDWEQVKSKDDNTIKRWIANQMDRRTCTIVLIGAETAGRKWINYEIEESWRRKMGVVGLHIHSLQDSFGYQAVMGVNPFYGRGQVYHSIGKFYFLSEIIKIYNPPFSNSKDCYGWIENNINEMVEEAIRIRNYFP